MSKSIHTLIPDIQHLVTKEKGWFDEQVSDALRASLTVCLADHFNRERYAPNSGTLRLSAMGPRCPRALWYSVRHPELAEPLPPWAEIKFAFGYLLEGLGITLAQAAGHDVRGEQDELTLDGIVGHRDCVIDGCTVDIKSCSSIQFVKYKSKTIGQSDGFGYLDQLDGYVVASNSDSLVQVKNKGYIFAIDKTLGHMCLYEHEVTDERERTLRDRIVDYKRIVEQGVPPPCTCKTKPEGASGNVRLDTVASYSPYKYCCFPFLRTFIYSNGPVFLSKVVRVPEVTEVTKHGKTIYH